MSEEESRRRARVVLEALPDDMRGQLIEAAWRSAEEVCEESGVEVTPELVAAVVVDVVQHLADDAESRFNEITEEAMDRIIGEEFDRLNTDPERGVEEDALIAAVDKRSREEYGYIFSPRRRRPRPPS